MQDYVNEEYKVIPFWPNHSWNSIGLPDNIAEINACLKEICRRIDARSERIIAYLKEQAEKPHNAQNIILDK